MTLDPCFDFRHFIPGGKWIPYTAKQAAARRAARMPCELGSGASTSSSPHTISAFPSAPIAPGTVVPVSPEQLSALGSAVDYGSRYASGLGSYAAYGGIGAAVGGVLGYGAYQAFGAGGSEGSTARSRHHSQHHSSGMAMVVDMVVDSQQSSTVDMGTSLTYVQEMQQMIGSPPIEVPEPSTIAVLFVSVLAVIITRHLCRLK